MTSLQLVQAGSSGCKCLHLSHSTHVGWCPFFVCVRFGFPVHGLTQSVEIESCQPRRVCYLSALSRKVREKFLQVSPPPALHNHHEEPIKSLFIIIYTRPSCVRLQACAQKTRCSVTMKTYSVCNEYYTDRSSQKTMCCFWLKSNSRMNTSQFLVTTFQQRIQINETT